MRVFTFEMDDESRAWAEAFAQAGIELTAFSSVDVMSADNLAQARLQIEQACQTDRPVVLFRHALMELFQEEFFRSFPEAALVVPIGADALLLGVGAAEAEHVEAINRYLHQSGAVNVANAGLYIRRHLLADSRVTDVDECESTAFDGIIEFDSAAVCVNLEDYLAQVGRRHERYVGILVHRASWLADDLAAVRLLRDELAQRGIEAITVFSNANLDCRDFKTICAECFSLQGELVIDALINLQLFAVRAEAGNSVAEQSVIEYQNLGIPVINPIQSFYLTEEAWLSAVTPLAFDMPSALIAPEMAGGIEPVIIAVQGEDNRYQALPERVSWLASRIASLVRLRHRANADKKIVVMLHNSVCTGVEATIGKAYGLDSFASVVSLLDSLDAAGYELGEYPQSAAELQQLFMTQKAFSDFRWTAVEDIIESGGCLYQMSAAGEYANYFAELPAQLQAAMIETWGDYPGEGMVSDGNLIISGLQFGNVTVMVQPKRGCYGAKCTGEVCKILHDAACPPPHQYLASYRYIERVLAADAIIDIGTDGSLEYLPGKSNGLSELCWPNVVLGSTPEVYVYNAGVINEALLVKRRIDAVICDHLPPASVGADQSLRLLARHIDDYFSAYTLQNGQEVAIAAEINQMVSDIPAASRIMERAEDYSTALSQVLDAIHGIEQAQNISSPHVLGQPPDAAGVESYIREVCYGDDIEYDPTGALAEELTDRLGRTTDELSMVLKALDGGYIPSGESGMPDENGLGILPTGRNMFGLNIDKVPSEVAFERGRELAEQLLQCYLADEGRLPEQVAMNMISLDVTRSSGEQLSQFLWLLGVSPVWDRLGRVESLTVMPLDRLGRPRIDVTVRISGVLRDTWPTVVELMDQAVLMVANLDEDESDNFVVKHLHEYRAEAALLDAGEPPEPLTERRGTIRIFGDPPGSYGAGIDLALLASAWKDEADLARYFINASAFAYGGGLQGKKSVADFVDTALKVDLTTDTTSSRRVNALTDSFGMQVQGGYRLISRHLGNKKIRQYQSTSERNHEVNTESLDANIRRTVEQTLLNDFWLENTWSEGYDGASTIMSLTQSVFFAQCITDGLPDTLLDDLARRYVNDEEMRQWLGEVNPYALEEVARRLLELYTREKWQPDEQVLADLKANYLTIEGDMEEGLESKGELQAGNVVIVNDSDVEGWQKQLAELDQLLGRLPN